ncbi:hypothetical protein AB0E63_03300 [Kribbella sp. NPDC026596]|uniref:hypothetical protein n=1 Tax=Kribbella sp. NPDC026596 TaxID=3155122 RepID=UPI003408BF80
MMIRQRCLDVLERRDPDGLHAWLASAASAGGDPNRFLHDNDANRAARPARGDVSGIEASRTGEAAMHRFRLTRWVVGAQRRKLGLMR